MKDSQSNVVPLLSMLVFMCGALFLFGIALIMGAGIFSSVLAGRDIRAEQSIFLIAFGFEGLVLLAVAFFSFQKFLRKPSADLDLSISLPNWLIAAFAIVAAGSIAGGYLVARAQAFDWLLLPLLTVPAIVLPLMALLALGIKKLPLSTRWRTWSVLGLSMTLGPVVLLTLEICIGIVIFAIAVIYIAVQPELLSQVEGLAQQLRSLGSDQQAILDLLSPWLTSPLVMIVAWLYLAVLAPAVEEIFKPLGVWLFAGKLESQAQGFALGALSGAGYALVETMGVSGQTSDWAGLLFSRIGTGVMHITASALMGGAIVLAWRQRRYARLLGTYMLAVLLHGLWNTVAVVFTFVNLSQVLGQTKGVSTLQPALTAGLILLALMLLAILVTSNERLRPAIPSTPALPPDEDIVSDHQS